MTTVVGDLFAPSQDRLRRLRRMKLSASALLLLAFGLYAASFALPATGQADQFLRAASEAAMVGGLADWFAVTALFRRPLGLPIPHTALIPTRKDALAETLGGFITEHFLDAENLASHLEAVNLLGAAGGWLRDPKHAEAVSREALRAAGTALESVPPDLVTRAAVSALRLDMSRRSYAASAGDLLELVTVNRAYEPLAAVMFGQAAVQLRDPAFVPVIKEVIESAGWLGALWVTDRRAGRLLQKAALTLEEAVVDRTRPPWPQLHDGLLRAAALLRSDGPTARAVDETCRRQLDDPDLRAWVTDIVDGGIAAIRAALAEPGSDIGDGLARLLMEWGRRAQYDERFRAQARDLVNRILLSRIEDNPEFFIRFITGTVAKWDAEDTSRRIEIATGRDLQFIRINGTVVGAIAGVAIHALSLVL